MSLPYSKFVPITAAVQSPSFTVEKKHMLLAMDNPLIGASTPYLTYSGASALTNFKADFGSEIPEYTVVSKYFSFLSKTGTAPEKLIVARWYKEAAAPFVKGSKKLATVAELKAVSNGSFKLALGASEFEVVVDLSAISSYSDAASLIQTAVQANSSGGEAFTGATVVYNPISGGFIITSGAKGSEATIGAVTAGITGTDLSAMLGLAAAELSQGVNAETYAEFCDRIYNANSGGYSITTIEPVDVDSIQAAVAWLQGIVGNQTLDTMVRLVFNITDKTEAKTLQSTLNELGYTGYVVCYDPEGEYVNALDCAICAAIDFNVANGSINFNFQPATGYTPITKLGDVVNYQQGLTNLSLAEELDNLCISYVYSVGFGEQEEILYGMGLMQGDFATEDVQVNESALEIDIQTAVMNGFVSLNKLKLQGQDAKEFIASIVTPSFERFKINGAIAQGGTLSNTDRNSIYQATGNDAAADAVESNGYYFQVQDLTTEDIKARRVRILVCYLCGGVVNKIMITNNIYGA